ncbi:MAG TPA: glucoamylase family protein [Candidatus Acidoferrum sp.]
MGPHHKEGEQEETRRRSRREFLETLSGATSVSLLGGLAFSIQGCSGGSYSAPPPPPGDGYPGTDDQLMEEIEKAAFLFFWEQADPNTGQVKDRALAAGNDTRTVSSIAATGFGLAALCIGDQRGYQPHATIVGRVQTTLSFLLNTTQPAGMNGFFYHFVDMTTGARAFTSEVSSIDTAILLCGVLMCREYFSQDAQIPALATQIYSNVNFSWMLNGGATLSMGWTPENGFLTTRWDHYSELMMLYLLAMAAPDPALAIPASSWTAWTRPTISYQGLSYISGSDPLFVHQYSHAWFDFRNKHDAFANYFQNSIMATQAHRLFCISLATQFSDYSADLWGITSSDSKNDYVAWGGPSAQGGIIGPVDGSIVPCATGGSLPFDVSDTIHVLRWIRGHYPAAWQRYGYVDAFNPLTGWYDTDVLGIDVGISMLMAENQRTQLIWNTFMKNPEAQTAFQLAGFQPG